MNMRRLVWVALAAVAAAFFLLTQQAAPTIPNAIPNSSEFSFRMASSGIVDAEGGNFAVVHLSIYPNQTGEVSVFCSGRQIPQSILLLQHAAVPGVGEEVARKVEKRLAECGFSSRSVELEEANRSENAVIIAATGAVPEGLASSQESMGDANSHLIVLQSLGGRKISQQGAISEYNGSEWFEIVPLEPGGEGKAAADAALLSIVPSDAEVAKARVEEGNLTLAVGVQGESAYCRAVLLTEGACRAADSGRMEKLAGRLRGPSQMMAGKGGIFEFSLGGEEEVGRELRFFAVAYQGNEEVARQEIAGGKIFEGWASSFSLVLQKGGKYVVRVLDQFSRPHAAAYAEVVALQALPVSQDGQRFEFRLLYGGKGADGAVDAWIDGGERKEYFASNGTLVLYASPTEGKHVMNFEFGGLQAAVPFEFGQNSLLGTYLRLGVPAVLFLLAVYFLMRASKKPAYCISFPEFGEFEGEILQASPKEMLFAWRWADRKNGGHCLPCYADEIGDALLEKRNLKGKLWVDPYASIMVLRQLCEEGQFAEHEGMFIPKRQMGGFTPSQLFCLRMLHDCMLERGLAFHRKKIVQVQSSENEFAVFEDSASVLEGMGKKTRVVLFDSEKSLSDFLRSLLAQTRQNTRIKLAQSLGKISFMVARSKEILGALP